MLIPGGWTTPTRVENCSVLLLLSYIVGGDEKDGDPDNERLGPNDEARGTDAEVVNGIAAVMRPSPLGP